MSLALAMEEAMPAAAAPDIRLEVRGLAKSYGGVAALEPVSLGVRRGEFLTLLGPSGSGKTTLLMMVAGLVDPSAGRILIDGADITTRPAYRRDIGVVFQSYALFPHLSVFDNVAFPLEMRRRPKAEVKRAVAAALDLVRLGPYADRLPRELSGGQQQRVAFARAIVFEPSIVLMDEPLGALDKRLRDELKLEIRRLHRELGATIVYVTHDQDEAMLLSDRICLMNQARVAQLDTPAALYARPVSRFAAEFLGDSNILAATASGGVLRLADGQTLGTRDATEGAVEVLVRPERLVLARAGQPGLAAMVETVIDLGGVRQVFLRTAGGLGLRATQLGGGGPAPQPGNKVAAAVDPADVVVLPPGAGR
jgi:putative spermidine/putrescine transport system ATP-binding protein